MLYRRLGPPLPPDNFFSWVDVAWPVDHKIERCYLRVDFQTELKAQLTRMIINAQWSIEESCSQVRITYLGGQEQSLSVYILTRQTQICVYRSR